MAAWAVWSYATGGVARVLFDFALSDGEALADASGWVRSYGVLAPVGYVLAVIVEVVVAPVPSPILYGAGGAVFGGAAAGALTLAGNAAGAFASARLGRWLGEAWVRARLGHRHDALRAKLENRGFWVVLLLRLNPLTSSDVVAYAAGALGLRPGPTALATTLGVAPLVFVQTYGGPQLIEALPGTGLVLLVGGLIYAAVLIVTLFR
jgi:uncharacterized membrane protein YdjX (TVP38/TMEM64 family)